MAVIQVMDFKVQPTKENAVSPMPVYFRDTTYASTLATIPAGATVWRCVPDFLGFDSYDAGTMSNYNMGPYLTFSLYSSGSGLLIPVAGIYNGYDANTSMPNYFPTPFIMKPPVPGDTLTTGNTTASYTATTLLSNWKFDGVPSPLTGGGGLSGAAVSKQASATFPANNGRTYFMSQQFWAKPGDVLWGSVSFRDAVTNTSTPVFTGFAGRVILIGES